MSDINDELVQAIKESCNCAYTTDRFNDGSFTCDSNNDAIVTYSVTAYVSPGITTSGITDAVNGWSNSNPTINVGGVTLTIGKKETESNVGVIVGVVIAVVAFIVIVIAIVIVLAVIFRHTRIKYQTGETFG